MISKKLILLVFVIFVGLSFGLYAQQQILDFEEGADIKWSTDCETDANIFLLEDYYDDSFTGDGCLKVTGKFRVYPNDWGTYTDAFYIFDNKLDLSQYDEVRFWVKILDAPKVNRSLFFTCALMDYPDEASGRELWQWEGDYDLLYIPSDDKWHEVIIPFDRLLIPEWESTLNGVFDANAVYGFDFTVQGDSTAPDSVEFLIDNLVASKSTKDASLFNFDENESAGVWESLAGDEENNVFELKNNTTDMFEGTGCLEVNNIMNTWGTVNVARHTFDSAVDLTGATEIRFMLDIIHEPAGKDFYFGVSLIESSDENWRSSDKYAAFLAYGRPEGWLECAYPFADFTVYTGTENGVLDLSSISKFEFVVGGDPYAEDVDTLVFNLDNLYVTHSGGGTPVLDRDELMVPDKFDLTQNYPNPFNPSTKIRFTLDRKGITNLKIYNGLGQLVRTVIDNRNKLRGSYEYTVDMSDLPSGTYYYKLTHAGRTITKSMTLIK